MLVCGRFEKILCVNFVAIQYKFSSKGLAESSVQKIVLSKTSHYTVVPPVTTYGRLLKNGKYNVQEFQRLINGTLSSSEFSKSLANKQEAVGAYFTSSFIDQ